MIILVIISRDRENSWTESEEFDCKVAILSATGFEQPSVSLSSVKSFSSVRQSPEGNLASIGGGLMFTPRHRSNFALCFGVKFTLCSVMDRCWCVGIHQESWEQNSCICIHVEFSSVEISEVANRRASQTIVFCYQSWPQLQRSSQHVNRQNPCRSQIQILKAIFESSQQLIVESVAGHSLRLDMNRMASWRRKLVRVKIGTLNTYFEQLDLKPVYKDTNFSKL